MIAQPANVLLVDDDPILLRMLAATLHGAGHRTISEEDPVAARRVLEDEPIDLIISDLNLYMDDGRPFACVVRRECRQPLIVISGVADFADVSRMLDGLMPSALLAKPFDARRINDLVTDVIGRVRAVAEGERTQIVELAQSVSRALALRDVETNAHAQRVALWTRVVATAVGLGDEERFWASVGGLLHDVGKIGVPDAILHKPSALDAGEWAIMRRHPTLGAELIAPMTALARARDVVLYHHEAWNGGGYPDGLVGEAIPRSARIFAPIDAYDAMTSDRPYRRGMSHDEAVTRLLAGRAAQFDPEVIDAIVAIDAREWMGVRTAVDQGELLR